MDKKGQLTISDGPTIAMIVGMIFLMMATIALVGQEYRDAMPDEATGAQVVNETVTHAEMITNGTALDARAGHCNAHDFAIVVVVNESAVADTSIVNSYNYTFDTNTGIFGQANSGMGTADWYVTYTYSYGSVGCNVTQDMITELGDSTDLAGVVLTISLVGIILTVLIGIFVGFSRRGAI